MKKNMEQFDTNFTVVELRNLCKKFGIPVAGLKSVLIKRIIDHIIDIDNQTPEIQSSIQNIENQMPLTNLSRLSLFGVLRRRIRNSTQIESSESSESTSTSVRSVDTSIFWKLIQNLPSMLGVIGGAFALFRAYVMLHGEKVEIVLPGKLW